METPRVVLAMVPDSQVSSRSGSYPEPNHCNGIHHMKTRTVAIGPVLPPKTQHFKITSLAPIKYLSSDWIMTWSIRKLCSFMRCCTSSLQIWDLINIRWVTIENPHISLEIWRYFTAILWMLVGSLTGKQEVKEHIKLYNQHIDHVTIKSQHIYLIGGKGFGTV